MSALYNFLRLLLLNPNLRAYNLRVLLCSTMMFLLTLGLLPSNLFFGGTSVPPFSEEIAPSIIMISVSCLVLVHHITMYAKYGP
jgi:hypothetical protein